jgi:hypothetical protein
VTAAIQNPLSQVQVEEVLSSQGKGEATQGQGKNEIQPMLFATSERNYKVK